MESLKKIYCQAPQELHPKLVEFLKDYKIQFVPNLPELEPQDSSLILLIENGKPPIVKNSEGLSFKIDFDQDHLNYQRKGLRGKNEPLYRALGGHKGYRRVHDLSVGMGMDLVMAKQLGFSMSGNERSSLIYFLLNQALKRTQDPKLKDVSIEFSDAKDFLEDSMKLSQIEVLYFDPMYPHRKSSALPRKEMQIFRSLVGTDEDSTAILEKALATRVPRIVLKRPLDSELLFKPSYSIETKVIRFDIYQRS